jgi:UTP--glucose-1-phosphate uridylyltransferase
VLKGALQMIQTDQLIRRKMAQRGLKPEEIDNFLRMVKRIPSEGSGYVPLADTSAPESKWIFDSADWKENAELTSRGKKLLSKVVIIKLNGGRSTSMGGLVPKGTLVAKNGRSYLDIIIGQVESMRRKWQTDVPLVLMNSFFTHDPTMKLIRRLPVAPITFMQNQVPRLLEAGLTPMNTETEDDWAPPGHGDIYWSLKRTGLLDWLRSEGKRWAFISNLDNLAASLEPWIVGLLDKEGIEFLLEVTDRTIADRKGGTLVIRKGKLDLLEIAQVFPHEREMFMDIERFKVFNTNNVWVDLDSVDRALERESLRLPLIQNHKTILGQKIIQLETAMGAAIGAFQRARGLRVGRERFFPTKKVGDLFVLQSDVCVLDKMDRLLANPLRPRFLPLRPNVHFSSNFLEMPHEMNDRFEDPAGVSLLQAQSLDVSGPVFFERNVRIEGRVSIIAPLDKPYTIRRGSVLRDGVYP